MAFDILDAYWVAGTNPTTQVFSSGAEAFVQNTATLYDSWLNVGNFGFSKAVTAAADNGSGLVRLSLTSAGSDSTLLATGQRLLVNGVSSDADGIRKITVISSLTIDLQGTTWTSATFTAGALQGPAYLATDAALWATFNSYAVTAFQQGSNAISTSVDTTLSSPIKALTTITETGTSKKIILPKMRSPRAPPIGATFVIKNDDSSTHLFSLYKSDGATLIKDINPGNRLNLILKDNSTDNGTFSTDSSIPTSWTDYTPVVTASTGAITTASATGRYVRFDNTVIARVRIDITTNGSGAVVLFASLPFTVDASPGGSWNGGIRIGDLKTCSCGGVLGEAKMGFTLYDGTYPGANSTIIAGTLVYETSDP